jgi:adenine-specific DNA-methyltransferase
VGNNVDYVGFGALMDVANGMVQLLNKLQHETWKVVFKDNGFRPNSNKINIREILKSTGLEKDVFTMI